MDPVGRPQSWESLIDIDRAACCSRPRGPVRSLGGDVSVSDLEERLRSYAEPSSPTEREKQARALRMVKQALDTASSSGDVEVELRVKGSYANATNVRQDSDVDIAVVQKRFYIVERDGARSELRASFGYGGSKRYVGSDFRDVLEKAVRRKFEGSCDCSGKTAITVHESSARVSADIVPSFHYRRIVGNGFLEARTDGLTTLRTDGKWIVNYPDQQLINGRWKNHATFGHYKPLVRILKRVENDLAADHEIEGLASFFVECLMYNVPNSEIGYVIFNPLSKNLRAALDYIVAATAEGTANRWVEANGIKPLFAEGQSWDIRSAHQFAVLAQKRLGLV